MSSPPKLPKPPPQSANAIRRSLLGHLRRYATIVHGDGSDGLTPEEVQAQKDAGISDEVIQRVYFSKQDSKERESKVHVIQQLVLTDLRRIISEINGVNKNREVQGRLIGIVGFIFIGITVLEIRRPLGIFMAAKSALQICRTESARNIVSRTIAKLYAQSPIFWLIASVASITGYYLIRDLKMLIAIGSVTDTLERMQDKTNRLKRISDSETEILTGWRWGSVPWRDYMREPRAEDLEFGHEE